MTISRARQIQMTFPPEPDWALEDDNVLIELVNDYAMEPSCATSALGELSIRGHESVGDLCVFLLTEVDADKWLKLSAIESLPGTHLEKGLDAALGFIDYCDAEMLETLAKKVNFAFIEDKLPESLRKHEAVRKLGGERLLGCWDAIRFSGSLTRDEYIQAEKLAATSVIPLWKLLLLLGCGILIASIGLIGDAYYETLGMFMCGAGMTMVLLGRIMKNPELAWDQNPDYRRHSYGILGADGIDTHGENLWGFTRWSEMTAWKASDEMLVVLSPTGARVLPASHFSSLSQWYAACALCAAKLPQAKADKRESGTN